MGSEYFDPEIMRSASSTELHRHMSWVMAESGVPWESNDDTWCCPECFILFSLNVFRVRDTTMMVLADTGGGTEGRDKQMEKITGVTNQERTHEICGA